MGEMSPFLLFDGDDDAKMDKRGPHSGKTDVAKKVRFCWCYEDTFDNIWAVQSASCTCCT